MLKIKYSSNLEDSYYKSIATSKADKFKGLTFEEYYNQHCKKILGYNLKEILCGSFEKLLEIKTQHGTKFKDDKKIKRLFNYDKQSTKNFKPLISKLQPKISKFFEQYVEVHTCYYCNIEFINTFKQHNETKNAFTLDHVLEKATYPFLALSLYNLVPSCYTCNSKIKDSKIEFDKFSPTNQNFDFTEKVKFKIFLQNPNLQIEKENDFFVKLIENFSNQYDAYIKSLNLDDRYEYHKYKVMDLIKKRRDYPDSRLKELSILTGKTEEEIKQDLFGVYLHNKDLHKRPLSKLTKDILEQLEIV